MPRAHRTLFPAQSAGAVLVHVERIAAGLGLARKPESEDKDTLGVWDGGAGAERTEIRVTREPELDCVLVEAGALSEERMAAIAPQIAEISDALSATELLAAAAQWRSDPPALVRAALAAAPKEVTAPILEGLAEGDDEQWRFALMAAMMLPPEESLWIVGWALARERDPARRERLSASQELLHSGQWRR